MSVVHNVLFKLKDGHSRDATASILQQMAGKIEELRGLEVGVDRLGTPRSYHVALIARFDSWEGLETYRTHPVHQEVLKHMAEAAEHSVVVDYEL